MDDLMDKAAAYKEDVFGSKPGWIKPNDIHPDIKWWSASIIVWAVLLSLSEEWFVTVLLVVYLFLIHRSFFRAKVEL